METGSLGLGIKNMDWVGKLDVNPAPSRGGGRGGGTSSFEHLNRVLLTLECTQGHKPLVI